MEHPPEEHFTIEADGITVSVSVQGAQAEQQNSLLLCNGLSSGIKDWGKLRSLLGRRTIAFDYPHAESLDSIPTVGQYADVLDKTLDVLDCEEVDVLGHSFGGLVGQELALSYGQRVGLILSGTAPGVTAAKPGKNAWMLLPHDRSPEKLASIAPALYGGAFCNNPNLVYELDMSREVNPEDHEHQFSAALSYVSLYRLINLPHETLILHARDDPIINFVNATLMQQAIRNSKLVEIEHGGHMFHRTHPGEVAQITNNFLDRQDEDSPVPSRSLSEHLMQVGTLAIRTGMSWLS